LRSPHAEVKPTQFRISVAIPLHNEEAVISELLSRLKRTLSSLEGGPHEIVLVDDGSTDSTASVLEEAARNDSRLVVVILSRKNWSEGYGDAHAFRFRCNSVSRGG
jgi:glycosyltransferase involved in cell wall biosynthesis